MLNQRFPSYANFVYWAAITGVRNYPYIDHRLLSEVLFCFVFSYPRPISLPISRHN